jgi:hypothetical protein
MKTPRRELLTDRQCDAAMATMRGYFDARKPVYGWFAALGRLVAGAGASFAERTALHLDLVQEATTPPWSGLPVVEQERLLRADLPFLEWQLTNLPLRTVLCTGATVSEKVREIMSVEEDAAGRVGRVRWWVGHSTRRGFDVGFAGWNIPLARATGLTAEGQRHLGEMLTRKLGDRASVGPRR